MVHFDLIRQLTSHGMNYTDLDHQQISAMVADAIATCYSYMGHETIYVSDTTRSHGSITQFSFGLKDEAAMFNRRWK